MSKITLIIPVYNSANYIEQTVNEIITWQKNNYLLDQVIFINDGSSDKTLEILKQIKKKYKAVLKMLILSLSTNQGKGQALNLAVQSLDNNSRFFVFTDAELPYGLDVIKIGLNKLNNTKLVFTQRQNKKSYSIYRYLANFLFRLLIPKKIKKYSDTQCGLKFFSTELGKKMFKKIRTKKWLFDLELYLMIVNNNLPLEIIEVENKNNLGGRGGLRFLRDGWGIIKDLLLINYYDRKNIYKI